MKREIRILGLDDGPYSKKDKEAHVVGVIYRGGLFPDGFLGFKVEIDGKDATEKLIKVINKSKHKEQLQYIVLKGITIAGFNYVDIQEVYNKTSIPILVVMREKPNMKKFTAAFKKVNPSGLEAIENAGKIEKIKGLYIQKVGVSTKEVKEILDMTCIHSNIPEPLRVAQIIASGTKD